MSSTKISSLPLQAYPSLSLIYPSRYPPPALSPILPNAHIVQALLPPPLPHHVNVLHHIPKDLLGTLSTKLATGHAYFDALHAVSLTTQNNTLWSELRFFITFPPISIISSLGQAITPFISPSLLASTTNSSKYMVLLNFSILVFNTIYSLWLIQLLTVHTLKLLLPANYITSTFASLSSVSLFLSLLLTTNWISFTATNTAKHCPTTQHDLSIDPFRTFLSTLASPRRALDHVPKGNLVYSTISPFFPFFFLTVPTPLFSAEGTRGDATDNLDRVEAIAKCLQQVGPKGVWLRFYDVERILGMHTGEIQRGRILGRKSTEGRGRRRP